MRESLRQLVFLCRHDQVCAEMNRRKSGMSSTMGLVANTVEGLVGPVNGLVVRVQGPDGTVAEVDGYSGCQALANLLRTPAVMDSVRQGVQHRIGSDPSVSLSLVLGAASQGAMRYMPAPLQSTPVTVTGPAVPAPLPAAVAPLPAPTPAASGATAAYPTGTRILGGVGGATSVHPAGTNVNSGATEHRYPPGTRISGGGAVRVGPPVLPPEIPAAPLSPPLVSAESHDTLEPLLDVRLAAAARLGRLVADPRLKFKIEGEANLKAEVRAAISELQSL
jgi:hypothetical protein